jgi:succinate-semialdehyde dehydrogenase/glutarate-semialdehyde dehydrogenase
MSAASPAYRVVDPFTGEVAEIFPFATDDDVQAALGATQSAYAAWKEESLEHRIEVVRKVGALFAERADELAAAASREMGKPLAEAKGEVEFCQAIFDYFADEAHAILADQPIKTFEGGKAFVQKLPIGPLLGIMPWNFPYYQVARFAAPNLVLGNTVLLKHAESVPGCALLIQKIMDDAGVPAGAYVNLFATHEQIATIIADPRVQGVSLTGSERAGAAVAAIAGANLKKCVLELGGSDPYVVLDSADVTRAARKAWSTRMYNTGQACNSNKRMIVMDDIFDDFVAALTERAQGLTPAESADDGRGTYAPLSSRAAAETLAAQVADAVEKGATLHAGGVLAEGPAAFYSPAVLTGITPEMRAYREELFGPVAAVYKVSSDDEALTLANDTAYGLGGAVFSGDADRASAVAQKLEVGMANVNTPAGEGAELPFGGVKRSGFGRELGPLGMDEFVNKRLFYVGD